MPHVRTDALDLWFQWLEQEGLPDDALLSPVPYADRAVLYAQRRIPWDHFATLTERFAELVGGERALSEVMRGYIEMMRQEALGTLLGTFAHPRQVYGAVNDYIGHLIFTVPQVRHEVRDDGSMMLELSIPEPYRPCRAWFWACKGALSQIPSLVGWPAARVRLEASDRVGRFDITLRPRTSRLPRLRRLLPGRRAMERAATELSEYHAELRLSYEEIARANQHAAAQADRERRVARMGRRMAAEVELDALLDSMGRACVEDLGFAGAEIRIEVGEELVRRHGEPRGQPRDHVLQRAGRRLGVLRTWPGEGHEAQDLLGGALPWLSLAIENALHFDTVRQQKGRLEDQVTAQQRTNAALEASEARWRALAESLPDTVVTIERDGRMSFLNRTSYGIRSQDVIGRDVRDFANVRERFEARLREVFEEARTVGGEDVWAAPDGRDRFMTWRMGPVVQDGQVAAAVFVVRDETQRYRAEEERRELERRMLHAQKLESLGVLAGGIAHDFNNLLMGITANAELAELHLDEAHPARRFVDRIDAAGQRAADLTRQMLAYAGRGSMRPEPVDVSRMVRELGDLLLSAVPKRVRLVWELAPDLPPVEADAAQLQQVVMNVLTNAADAVGEAGGEVRICTGVRTLDAASPQEDVLTEPLPPGRYVCVEIVDDGVGMDEAIRRRIFDPFFSTKSPGRGLGLAAVLGIVRAHRGGLTVRSQPGRGTWFQILLPVSNRPAPVEASRARRTDARLAGRTVLVVDDEPVVRQVAVELLRHYGAEVVQAADGAEALERFAAEPDLDVVLLDLTMPGAPGDEVFAAMHDHRPEVPVVLTSGYDARDVVAALQERGLAGFIRKPWDGRSLIEIVAQVLG